MEEQHQPARTKDESIESAWCRLGLSLLISSLSYALHQRHGQGLLEGSDHPASRAKEANTYFRSAIDTFCKLDETDPPAESDSMRANIHEALHEEVDPAKFAAKGIFTAIEMDEIITSAFVHYCRWRPTISTGPAFAKSLVSHVLHDIARIYFSQLLDPAISPTADDFLSSLWGRVTPLLVFLPLLFAGFDLDGFLLRLQSVHAPEGEKWLGEGTEEALRNFFVALPTAAATGEWANLLALAEQNSKFDSDDLALLEQAVYKSSVPSWDNDSPLNQLNKLAQRVLESKGELSERVESFISALVATPNLGLRFGEVVASECARMRPHSGESDSHLQKMVAAMILCCVTGSPAWPGRAPDNNLGYSSRPATSETPPLNLALVETVVNYIDGIAALWENPPWQQLPMELFELVVLPNKTNITPPKEARQHGDIMLGILDTAVESCVAQLTTGSALWKCLKAYGCSNSTGPNLDKRHHKEAWARLSECWSQTVKNLSDPLQHIKQTQGSAEGKGGFTLMIGLAKDKGGVCWINVTEKYRQSFWPVLLACERLPTDCTVRAARYSPEEDKKVYQFLSNRLFNFVFAPGLAWDPMAHNINQDILESWRNTFILPLRQNVTAAENKILKLRGSLSEQEWAIRKNKQKREQAAQIQAEVQPKADLLRKLESDEWRTLSATELEDLRKWVMASRVNTCLEPVLVSHSLSAASVAVSFAPLQGAPALQHHDGQPRYFGRCKRPWAAPCSRYCQIHVASYHIWASIKDRLTRSELDRQRQVAGKEAILPVWSVGRRTRSKKDQEHDEGEGEGEGEEEAEKDA